MQLWNRNYLFLCLYVCLCTLLSFSIKYLTSAQYFRVILAYPIFINSVSVQNSSNVLCVYTASMMFSSWISDYQYLLEIDNLSKILFVNNRLAYIMSVNIPSDLICVNMFVVYFSVLPIFLVSLDVCSHLFVLIYLLYISLVSCQHILCKILTNISLVSLPSNQPSSLVMLSDTIRWSPPWVADYNQIIICHTQIVRSHKKNIIR